MCEEFFFATVGPQWVDIVKTREFTVSSDSKYFSSTRSWSDPWPFAINNRCERLIGYGGLWLVEWPTTLSDMFLFRLKAEQFFCFTRRVCLFRNSFMWWSNFICFLEGGTCLLMWFLKDNRYTVSPMVMQYVLSPLICLPRLFVYEMCNK